MKTWSYYELHVYAEKESWYFNLLDEKCTIDMLDDALNYLGDKGWECIGVTSHIGTDFTNVGIIPIYVENIRTDVGTYLLKYLFKRERDEAQISTNYFDNNITKNVPKSDGKKYTQEDVIHLSSDVLRGNLNKLTVAVDYYMKQYGFKRNKVIGNRLIYSSSSSPIDCKVFIENLGEQVSVDQGAKRYDFFTEWDKMKLGS